MSDPQNNIRFTWHLVSQFVSWEFCRFMFEEKEDHAGDTDVLTFLRNMIVQRTEKSMSEITKHEIVAKFIMETKGVRNISRMSCIIPLSESVKAIFPELEPAVSKLVHYLESFLNVLESTVEDRKELIHMRIDDAINDFIKEANRLLPQPHLLQVLDSWNAHQGHSPPKRVKKVIYNATLFEKTLECLHFDSITPAEAKLIAVALYEDKVFEKILLNAEAEPETEADSDQFSLSVYSSQHNENIFSQEFMKNSQTCKVDRIPLHLQPPNIQGPSSSHLDPCPPVLNNCSNLQNNLESEPHSEAPELLPAASPPAESPPVYPFMHRGNSIEGVNNDVSGPTHASKSNALNNLRITNETYSHMQFPQSSANEGLTHASKTNPLNNLRTSNKTYSHMQFAQSSANESQSDDFNSALHDKICMKFKEMYNNQRMHNASDSDTSDCEKNPQFRFLTPTFYKKGAKKELPKTVWLSDTESNNSSVITTAASSQRNDPNWSSHKSICSSIMSTKKKKRPHNRKKPVAPPPPPPPRRRRAQIYSDSSSSDVMSEESLENMQFRPSVSTSNTDFTTRRPTKKRKLYGTPNRSIHDFVTQVRRSVPDQPDGIPVPKPTKTTRTSTRKQSEISVKKNNWRQKCKQCSKTFKTVISLRRHVFLQHTQPPENSDCDSL